MAAGRQGEPGNGVGVDGATYLFGTMVIVFRWTSLLAMNIASGCPPSRARSPTVYRHKPL